MTTFALVHGAWHGAWCWDLLIPELERLGHRAVAVDLPCDDWDAGLADNVAVVTGVLDAAGLAAGDGDVVVVGHSMGGITVPLVADRRPVRHLVFLCALLPEPGRSLDEALRADPDDRPTRGWGDRHRTVHPDGSVSWRPEGAVAAFYHDCPDDVADWAAARLRPQVWTTSREPCPLERWPEVPASYILCTEDAVIAPEWSRRVARERLGVEAIELPGSHSPFLSRPADLAEILDGIARG